jgi:hypothetical protein
MFLENIEELHLHCRIASESSFAYHWPEPGPLSIGEGEGTMWRSRLVWSFYPDSMDLGASQLEQIGDAGDMQCHIAFGLSKFLQEHELPVPGLQGNPLLVSEERSSETIRVTRLPFLITAELI